MKFVDMLCGSEKCAILGKKADFVHHSLVSGAFYPWCKDCHSSDVARKGLQKCDYGSPWGKCIKVQREASP